MLPTLETDCMTADQLVWKLAVKVYEDPLVKVRSEPDYPNLGNPLHLVTLLIDADTEITMNSILGFLENMTGDHLSSTIEALDVIGAPKCAAVFRAVEECMKRHSVTWNRLRGDLADSEEFQVSSFRKPHQGLELFAKEVCELVRGFELFNTLYCPEDAFGAICGYLESRLPQLNDEIERRVAQTN
jgi:hypothetical protein